MRKVQQSGLTLIELMISMVITTIAIAAALSMGFVMMDSYRDHIRSSASERSARIALEYITDAVRNSVPGVNTGLVVDLGTCSDYFNGTGGVGDPTDEGGIWVDNAVGGVDSPDELYVIYAAGGAVGTLTEGELGAGQAFQIGDSVFKVTDPGINISGAEFAADDYLLITDFAVGHVVKVTGVAGPVSGEYTITIKTDTSCFVALQGINWPALGYEPFAAAVIRVKLVHFFVDTTNNILWGDDLGDGLIAQPIADGIEDLQIAVGVDISDDDPSDVTESAVVGRFADDDEWFYNIAGEADPPAASEANWRALRITVTAVSTGESSGVAFSLRPAIEDRPASTLPDNRRRRSLTSTIDVRNLEGSP